MRNGEGSAARTLVVLTSGLDVGEARKLDEHLQTLSKTMRDPRGMTDRQINDHVERERDRRAGCDDPDPPPEYDEPYRHPEAPEAVVPPERPLLRVLGGLDGGREFAVRVVRFGERYGLNNCLTHRLVEQPPKTWNGDTNIRDVLVEFYDASRGVESLQFVSRYYLGTLRERARIGLNLDSGSPEWCVTATAVDRAVAYADGIVCAIGDGAN